MQRISRPEGLDIPTPQLQRNQSRSSDRDHTPSISGASSLLSPPSVKPDPAYIAASAASQIVNSDLANRDEAFDSGGKQSESDTVVVSPASLILLNAFLDQLLFSFLASSRSTSIAALRPAILEILKPRLGKEAIDGADEELQGYLAGGDAEELLAFHGGWGFKGDHNLNLVWRRTRLRCMVYTRLGDMEEEDEETYLEQELEENGIDGRPRLTRDLGEISPAAAIFLTSIVEFIGEHSLLVAGEAAYNRFQTKKPTSDRHRPMVEELDMEKIAFNPSLGRLWRSWKKRVRNSTLLSPRPMSRELQRHKSSSLPGEDHSRKNNVSEDSYFDPARRPSVGEVLHEDRELSPDSAPDAVVLPEESDFHNMSTTENTDARAEETIQTTRNRPHSMIEYQMQRSESTIHTPTQDFVPKLFSGPRTGGARPTPKHMRSSSLPAKQTPYVSPIDETFTTPSEGPDPFVCEDDRANAEKEMPRLTDDSKMVPGLAGGDHAVSTMYDGAISQDDEVLPKGMAERTNRGLSTYTESSTTDEYDHEMTPQPLESNNMTENAPSETPGSRPSTVSTDYSFHVGEKDHVASPGGLGQDHVSKEIINEEEGAFPSRADSFDQSGVEPETGRQHIGNFANLATLQEQQLRTYDNSGKAVKRDIPVLYEAPSNEDVIYNPHASVRSSAIHEEEEVTTSKRADTAGAISQQGVPPLTPLRDLLDAAHDTSDEASSIAPSYGTPRSETFVPFLGSDSQRIPSYTSSNSNNAQPSTSTSKLIDLRGQPSTVNTGTERAAVQRVSPTTSSPLTPTGRTSTSTNCDVRPATSCSTGSQVSSKIKGLIGRESGDLIRQPIPHRTSSADSGSLISGQLRTPRSVDKEMDFEDLIKSDETVKYTLTPQNMREMETPDSARSDITGCGQDQPSSAGRLAKLKGFNGLRANPTNGTSPSAVTQGAASFDAPRSQPKELPRSPGVVRSPSGVIPREPTNRDDSLRDFADFIRSTGPDAAPNSMPKSTVSNATRQSRPGSSSSPKPPPKKTTKPSPIITPKGSISVPPKPEVMLPTRTTSKLQAREATVTNSNATADLADFLRSGPVGAQVDGPPQSKRPGVVVRPIGAPNGLSNGRLRDAVNSGSSVASTQESFAPSKMTQSSTNSRTGLLENSNHAPPVAPPVRNNVRQPASNDDASGPARTQRRVKDPYALDSDSEEDGYGTAQPPEREEESLSDFLRNYNPPPTTNKTRNVPVVQTTAPQPKKQTTTIRERIARNIAVIPDYRPLPPKAPKKNPSKSPPQSNESRTSAKRTNSASYQGQSQNNNARGRPTNAAPQLPPINPRAASPHLVTQNGTKMDTYRPTQPTYAKHVDRRPRKQLQAREEHGSLSRPPAGGEMGDLADFLRETEPPPPSGSIGGGRPMSPMKEKEESTFGRMFSRRKKEGR